MKRNDLLALAGFLILSFLVSGLGGLFSVSEIGSWYSTLNKPAFNPPGWVFGPVWTILYILIAISGWYLYRRRTTAGFRVAFILFFVQLFLNALWSPLFFGAHEIFWALVDLALLWIAIGVYIFTAWRVSRISVYLFTPYWAWVSFAFVLNFSVWLLN